MPLYDFICPERHRWDEQRPIAERNEAATCPECGKSGKRAFVGAPIIPWYPDTTRSPYKEKLRHH